MLYTSVIPLNLYVPHLLLLNQNSSVSKIISFNSRTVPYIRTEENLKKAKEKRINFDKSIQNYNDADSSKLSENQFKDTLEFLYSKQLIISKSCKTWMTDYNTIEILDSLNNTLLNKINEIVKPVDVNINSYNTFSPLIKLLELLNKVFGVRFLDYTSFPLFLLPFVFYTMFKKFKEWLKTYPDLTMIIYFIFIHFLVYIIRDSFSRYLYNSIPFFSIFLIIFFKEFSSNKKSYFILLIIGFILLVGTLYFDYFIPQFTIPAGIFFMILLLIIGLNKKIIWDKQHYIYIFFFALSFFTMGLRIGGDTLSEGGVINQTIFLGQNSEYKEISKYFESNKNYWFNGRITKIGFYSNYRFFQKNTRSNLLPDFFPKKHLFKNYKRHLYDFEINLKTTTGRDDFIQKLKNNNIKELFFLRSTIDKYQEKFQHFIPFLDSIENIMLTRVVKLKNRELLIYKIDTIKLQENDTTL